MFSDNEDVLIMDESKNNKEIAEEETKKREIEKLLEDRKYRQGDRDFRVKLKGIFGTPDAGTQLTTLNSLNLRLVNIEFDHNAWIVRGNQEEIISVLRGFEWVISIEVYCNHEGFLQVYP